MMHAVIRVRVWRGWHSNWFFWKFYWSWRISRTALLIAVKTVITLHDCRKKYTIASEHSTIMEIVVKYMAEKAAELLRI